MSRSPRRPPKADEPRERLRLDQPRDEVRARLEGQAERGRDLASRDMGSRAQFDEWNAERKRWVSFTREALRRAYNTDEPHNEFQRAATPSAFVVGPSEDLGRRIRDTKQDILAAVNVIDSLVERLELLDEPSGVASQRGAMVARETESRRVFVVHGRDEGLRDQVARVLMRLDFEPEILSEEPWKGRTLIEKFEDKTLDVGFAVVILSPDDFGRGPDEAEFPADPNRARQNVILELGYFMGALGRDHVAALYDPRVELPSDIHGLGWIPLADSSWPYRLGGELAAAGFDVDLNRLR